MVWGTSVSCVWDETEACARAWGCPPGVWIVNLATTAADRRRTRPLRTRCRSRLPEKSSITLRRALLVLHGVRRRVVVVSSFVELARVRVDGAGRR